MPKEIETKFCKDCIHADKAVKYLHPSHLLCMRTAYSKTDPVTGKLTKHATLCSNERLFPSQGRCGPDGIFFEQSPTKKLVKESKFKRIIAILKE